MLKNGKAPGKNDIITELLKNVIKAWREEEIPEVWNFFIRYTKNGIS